MRVLVLVLVKMMMKTMMMMMKGWLVGRLVVDTVKLDTPLDLHTSPILAVHRASVWKRSTGIVWSEQRACAALAGWLTKKK